MNEAVKKLIERYKIVNRANAELALREILQEIALLGLWRSKFFEHAAFYGGTALRILYGLDRFSEDLDFTLLKNGDLFSWSTFERSITEELFSYGFEISFIEKKKQFSSAVQSAFLKTNTQHALMQIGVKDFLSNDKHPDALIKIKVEIDTQPILGFEVESKFILEPIPFTIRALQESSLFAGKTHAALYRAWKGRVKGRDWYDMVWFLRKNIPLNSKYLEYCMRSNSELAEDEALTLEKVKYLLKNRISQINIDAIKDDVRPFLRDPMILDVWSTDFFHHMINLLKFQ